MIERNFRCRETERIFGREYSRRLPTDIQKTALRKLRMLNRSSSVEDLRVPPGNRLEALSGNRKGKYSIQMDYDLDVADDALAARINREVHQLAVA